MAVTEDPGPLLALTDVSPVDAGVAAAFLR
jgi:hypothetical protein